MGWLGQGSLNLNDAIGSMTGYNPGTGNISPAAENQGKDIFTGTGTSNPTTGLEGNGSGAAAAALTDAQQQDANNQKELGIANNLRNPYGLQGDIFNKFRNNRLSALASTQKQTSQSLSNRGLLYGPGSQGAQTSNVADYASQLTQGKSDIQSAANEQASQIENQVLNNGLQVRQTQQAMYDTIYNGALQQYQAQQQAQSSLIQGAAMTAAVLA